MRISDSFQIRTGSMRSRLALSFILLAFLSIGSSLSASYINYRQQNRADLRQRLLNIVSLAALQQNGDIFASIKSPDDHAFEQMRLQNLRIRSSDPDLSFVYTMRFDAQGLYFVVDAVEPGDPLGSAYGERYLEPGPALAANYVSLNKPLAEENFYTDEYGTFLSAYAPFFSSDNKLAGIIGVDISASKIVARERQTLVWFMSIFAISLPVLGIAGWLLGNNLAKPISTLTQAAVRVSEGEFDYRPGISGASSEVTLLGKSFYSMADQLRTLIGNLEQRITERTQELERRASQLQVSAEIGAAVTRIRDLDELLGQVTHLISKRFGFYHIGVFLLDNQEEYAVLRAANSEGGQRMLARGHKLKIGQVGIVGNVTGTGQARIALDVGHDATFFNNPDLPETHSEMALPLIVGGKILGALDVQSKKEAAFTDEDTSILKVLADQIAIAIENARLFSSTQNALDKANRAYSDISEAGWQHLLINRETELGYVSLAGNDIQPVAGQTSPEFIKTMKSGQNLLSNDNSTLHIPIKVRGNMIGAIRLDKQTGSKWSEEDMTSAAYITEQLGTALESARLYGETNRRALRERLLGEISTKIGASSRRETILRTAVEELGRVLPGSEVIIQFQNMDEPVGKVKKK